MPARLSRNNRLGQALILVTLTLIPMFGLLGLAVDLGWMEFTKKAAQTAADAAAIAALLQYQSTTFSATYTCGVGGIICQVPRRVVPPPPAICILVVTMPERLFVFRKPIRQHGIWRRHATDRLGRHIVLVLGNRQGKSNRSPTFLRCPRECDWKGRRTRHSGPVPRPGLHLCDGPRRSRRLVDERNSQPDQRLWRLRQFQ
jgi:hypothetical protein